MKRILFLIIPFIVVCIVIKSKGTHVPIIKSSVILQSQSQQQPQQLPLPIKNIIPQPVWIKYPAVRQPYPNIGKILSDLDSHINNDTYRDIDRINWAHETSHGIASQISIKYYNSKNGRVYGLYALANRGIIIQEPPITLSQLATKIPTYLQGKSYYTYFHKQTRYFQNEPLYILDEWISYTNGSAVRAELNIKNRGETVLQMVEFNTYALLLAKATNNQDPQFKNFIIWNSIRVKKIYDANKVIGGIQSTDEYLKKLKYVQKISKQYFGENWDKTIFSQ
jgi:hypothetical protein